jgi:hypothetical protein
MLFRLFQQFVGPPMPAKRNDAIGRPKMFHNLQRVATD